MRRNWEAGTPFQRLAGALAVLAVVGGLFPHFSYAGTRTRSIVHVEAAFVYQFTRYVEWPEESFERSGDSFVIAVVDDRELCEALSKVVADKRYGNRSYRVVEVGSASQAPFAHIVFISRESDPVAALDAGVEFDGHTLTVGEHETFTRNGGIMRLYEDKSRLRIEVNIDAVRRSQLKVSSKLLDLARIVRDEAD